jgi:hypothetical protein
MNVYRCSPPLTAKEVDRIIEFVLSKRKGFNTKVR